MNNQRSLIWHFLGFGVPRSVFDVVQAQESRSNCLFYKDMKRIVLGVNRSDLGLENGTKCHFFGGISSVCISVYAGPIRATISDSLEIVCRVDFGETRCFCGTIERAFLPFL